MGDGSNRRLPRLTLQKAELSRKTLWFRLTCAVIWKRWRQSGLGDPADVVYAPVTNDRDAPRYAPVNNESEPDGPHSCVGPVPSRSTQPRSAECVGMRVCFVNLKACAQGFEEVKGLYST